MSHAYLGLAATLILSLTATPSTRPGSAPTSEPPPDLVEVSSAVQGFVQALHDSQWAKAIGYCSPQVQEQARQYPSPEAFFRDVVPLEELTKKARATDYALKHYPAGSKGAPWQMLTLNFMVAELEEDPSLPWTLSMFTGVFWRARTTKVDSRWCIDFQTSPLRTYIEKDLAERRQRRAELAAKERELDPILRGVHTHLTPLRARFKGGQEMLFRLELVNDGPAQLLYDHSTALTFNSMIVKDEHSRAIPRDAGPGQTWGVSKLIEPGQTVVLFDKWDLRKQCRLTNPGRYKVQFQGGIHVAVADPKRSVPIHRPRTNTFETQPAAGRRSLRTFPSNIVEIEVVATQPASRPGE